MDWKDIVIPALVFAGLGLLLGAALAIASRIFAVREDERIGKIAEILPGANCGGCGYSGCEALARAIVRGEAAPHSCAVGGNEVARKIGAVMGVEVGDTVRMRAQVMCSGAHGTANLKYQYVGAQDCWAAAKLGGGDKMCPSGCIGLGSCAAACPFGAIQVRNGLAEIDRDGCRGCGVCLTHCPQHIIRLIPYDARYWVACQSVENGKNTRQQCQAGCISCHLCEKNCPSGAIHVDNFVASIQQGLCTGCGRCAEKCPRHIIHMADGHAAIPTA